MDLLPILRYWKAHPSATSALATLVDVQGSSYRRKGARLLLDEQGATLGSVSGGCLEADVIARLRPILTTKRAETVTYDTTSENDLVWGVGLGCHGVVTLLLEPIIGVPPWAAVVDENLASRRPTLLQLGFNPMAPGGMGTTLAPSPGSAPSADENGLWVETVNPPPRLLVFGAGNDAQPLVAMAAGLGWDVIVADPRPAYAIGNRFPEASRVVTGGAETLVRNVAPGPGDLVAVMTHHFVHDVPILRDLLPLPLTYLGLLGPRKRAERILGELKAQGADPTPNALARLHAPMGLDLGGDTPAEVALSALAEMQARLHGRSAGALRDRKGSIHGALTP
jgi:xanthine dehydrogenase accessory factor